MDRREEIALVERLRGDDDLSARKALSASGEGGGK